MCNCSKSIYGFVLEFVFLIMSIKDKMINKNGSNHINNGPRKLKKCLLSRCLPTNKRITKTIAH